GVCLREWLRSRVFALAPPPAAAGGGWEGVPTARADPDDTPPQPVRPASTADGRSAMREPMARKRIATPPAFAGEGAKALRRSGGSRELLIFRHALRRFAAPAAP